MDPLVLGAGVGALVILVVLYRFKPRLVRVKPHHALLRSRSLPGAPPREVFFDRAVIIPAVDTYDLMDISIQSLEIQLAGSEGVHCRDNIRADVTCTAYLKVPRVTDSVLIVAQTVGCERASDIGSLQRLFRAKFVEVVKSVFKGFDFEEIYTKREPARDSIIDVVGVELNGFYLEDFSIESIEQTPLDQLDPENILDAEGITKITDRTAAQHVATNKIRRATEKEEHRRELEHREQMSG